MRLRMLELSIGKGCQDLHVSKQHIAKLQVKETDENPIIPATAFTKAIKSIVQHPITDSDADLKMSY